jgi:hypothetical protein
MVPNLEAGNILFKELQYLAGALAAGVVVGAKVPIVLTSRADGELARMASCALGVLLAKPAPDRLRQSRFFRRLQQLASHYLKAIPNDLGRSRCCQQTLRPPQSSVKVEVRLSGCCAAAVNSVEHCRLARSGLSKDRRN